MLHASIAGHSIGLLAVLYNVVVFIIYVFLFIAFVYLMFECTLATSRVYYGYEEPPDRAKRRWTR